MELAPLFEMSQELLVMRDLNGKILAINAAFANALEWNSDEAREVDFNTLVHPDDLAARPEEVLNAAETGGFRSWQCRCRTKSGTYRWIDWSCSVDTSQKQSLLVGRDVTSTRERLESLETNARSLENALALARVANWSFDLATATMTLSDELYRLFGIEPGEFEPTWDSFVQRIHPDDRDGLGSAAAAALAEPEEREIRILRADGEIRHIKLRIHITHGSDDAPTRLDGAIEDITERKLSEAALSQVLTHARCLLWQAEVTWDGNDYVWATQVRNAAAAAQFLPIEIPPGGDYTSGFYYAKLPENGGRVRRTGVDALREGQSAYRQEYRVRLKSGDIRWLFEDVSIQELATNRWLLTGVCTDITDRKKIGEELDQVLASARCMLWQATVRERQDGDFTWDLHFRNPEAALQFLPVEIPAGGNYSDGLHRARPKAYIDAVQRRSQNALRSGLKGYQQEFPIRVITGDMRWISEDVNIEPLEPGTWLLTGVCTDITEQKNAQQETAQVLASARCLLWQAEVFDRDGEIEWHLQFRNPDAAQIFLPLDIPEGETYSTAFTMARPKEYDISCTERGVGALRTGQDGYQHEFPIRSLNGELRWLSEDVHIDRQEPGRWRLTGVCIDITERKRVESSMAQVQASARCLLWQAKVVDIDGVLNWTIEVLNPEAAQELLAIKVRPGQPYAYALQEARVPENREQGDAFSTAALRSGQDSYEQEFPIQTASGEIRWLAESAKIESEGEGHWSLTGVCVDITPRKHLEELMAQAQADLQNRVHDQTRDLRAANFALQQEIAERNLIQEALLIAKEEAERANQAKSEFLSRMSHELRTPLNAILGFGQYLERNELQPLQKESVQHILRGGRHLLDLINEVLDLAKLESGRTEVSLEPVSISELVRESVALLGSLGVEYQVQLIADLDALQPCFAMADKQRMKQVLINLLSNAIKYNRPGGSVTLSCVREGDLLHVDVRDTGIGIHPDDVPKLFRPFERLAAANSAVEGTGLGLALSRQLVGLIGGSLTMESEWNRGSKFRISLPAAECPTESFQSVAAAEASRRQETRVAKRRTVLCIEDNLSNLRLMEVVLASRPGVALKSAMQGRVGIDLARQLRPDVILLDLNLPDISGRQVLEQLRRDELTKDLPVIVISADATPLRLERLLAIGANAYLTKPLDVAEFLAALDNFMK